MVYYQFIGLMVFIVGMQGTAAALAHVYSGKVSLLVVLWFSQLVVNNILYFLSQKT